MWTAEHRRNASGEGMRYLSDLTDDEWRLVEPFIPPTQHGGRCRDSPAEQHPNSQKRIVAQ
jgi:hypothetical protein